MNFNYRTLGTGLGLGLVLSDLSIRTDTFDSENTISLPWSSYNRCMTLKIDRSFRFTRVTHIENLNALPLCSGNVIIIYYEIRLSNKPSCTCRAMSNSIKIQSYWPGHYLVRSVYSNSVIGSEVTLQVT